MLRSIAEYSFFMAFLIALPADWILFYVTILFINSIFIVKEAVDFVKNVYMEI